MSIVKILIEGYARPGKNDNYIASSATILIEDSDKKILVDPGCNRELLVQSLNKNNLRPKDIDIIFLTHYHPDHIINIRLFPEHDIYDGNIIYHNDEEIEFVEKIPGTNIEIIETPGHANEHASLLVFTDEGRYAIAGDIFWWEDEQEQNIDYESLINLEDQFVKDEQKLKNSREKILKIADFIIPGHGKMFKVVK